MSTFAIRLKLYMEKANMKQAELAEKTKINKSSISEYLSGNYEPKQRNIYKMALALGIKPSQLMGIDSEEPAPAPLSLTQQEETLVKKYRQLDADGREEIDDLIDVKLAKLQRSAQKEEANLG